MELPHHQVQEGGDQQGDCAEHVRELAAARIGHDAGRHFEDDLPDGEERVRGEGLGVVQPGVEQEEGIDAPDERGRQRGEERQREVGPLNAERWIVRTHIQGSMKRRSGPALPSGDGVRSAVV